MIDKKIDIEKLTLRDCQEYKFKKMIFSKEVNYFGD